MTPDQAVDSMRMRIRELSETSIVDSLCGLPPKPLLAAWAAELILNALEIAYDDPEESDGYLAAVLARHGLEEPAAWQSFAKS